MEYVVTRSQQIAVTAENPEEAQKKVLNGEGVVMSSTLGASPRPQARTSSGPIGQVGQHPIQPSKS